MSVQFRVPDLPDEYASENTEGIVFGLSVRNGAYVTKEDVLFSAEFERFVLEATAPGNGRVQNLSVSDGSRIQPGAVLFEIDITANRPWYRRSSAIKQPVLWFSAGVGATLITLAVVGLV